ncbi:YlxR family protein [Propionibacterium freudenreichii]|nr:YlxR family protein [Propionibacterium freudenreichii]MCT2977383.1 YlxR family protein [Propionibacterium freudenreichii]MCT2984381.1 YlxR family protein [Propionibacterium freudenreichii]MCT2985569.1 YlxR family protein [Propionibacterium freudenreichii]MDK9675404.1 YlxR family protein [Propionibacterium freudenreichii]
MRTCAGCRRVVPAPELTRFVVRDQQVVADPREVLPGRGAWLHRNEQCWVGATRGGFARSFRQRVHPPQAPPPGW